MRDKQNQAQQVVTPHQIKMIHTLKGAIGMDDEQYRFALYEGYRVESSKGLTFVQAERLLRDFKDKAIALGVWKERSRATKHQGLKGRIGYASPAQLSYIEGLWKDVSRVPEEEQAKALRSFLMRVVEVSDLRFVTSAQASNVISALKQMKARKQKVEV